MRHLHQIATAITLVVLTTIAGLNATSQAQAETSVTQAITAKQTITLAVENMTCAACPITVRKAIERVKGVKSVSVNFKAKTATVVFDPSVATPEEIGAASTNAGYPAAPKS